MKIGQLFFLPSGHIVKLHLGIRTFKIRVLNCQIIQGYLSRCKLNRTSQDSAIIYMAVKGPLRLATIICENAVGQCVNASMRQCKM